MKLALALAALALTSVAHAAETDADFAAFDAAPNTPPMNVNPQSRAEAAWAKMPSDGFVKSGTYSEYFFLPATGENSAQFNYRQKREPRTVSVPSYDPYSQQTYSSSETEATDYDVHYARNISPSSYLTLDVGYETESTSSGDMSLKSSGLKDIGFGLTSIARRETWNLVYGSNFTVSPANAVIATPNGVRGNRFSGGYGMDPFIGFETTSHTAAWGARMNVALQFNQSAQSGFNHPVDMVAANGFYEVPVLPTARVGFTVGAAHDSNSIVGFQSALNNFSAGAYSRISLKQQADILVGVTALTHDQSDSSATETDATVGLRKSL